MDIDLRYNRKRNATNWELCPFEITDVDVEKQNDSQIDANIGGNWLVNAFQKRDINLLSLPNDMLSVFLKKIRIDSAANNI
jgi:hypothetical protein